MISLDMGSILTQAYAIVNGMWGIFIAPLGIMLGFSLLKRIFNIVKGAFGG